MSQYNQQVFCCKIITNHKFCKKHFYRFSSAQSSHHITDGPRSLILLQWSKFELKSQNNLQRTGKEPGALCVRPLKIIVIQVDDWVCKHKLSFRSERHVSIGRTYPNQPRLRLKETQCIRLKCYEMIYGSCLLRLIKNSFDKKYNI